MQTVQMSLTGSNGFDFLEQAYMSLWSDRVAGRRVDKQCVVIKQSIMICSTDQWIDIRVHSTTETVTSQLTNEIIVFNMLFDFIRRQTKTIICTTMYTQKDSTKKHFIH